MNNYRVDSIKLTFSFMEMVEALERAGFIIKEETVETEVHRGSYYEPCTHKVVNVYLTHSSTPCAEHAGYGPNRVKWVFEEELRSRMLGLFK